MAKIMNVFYGTDALPYKDQERQVHYPIVSGNTFNGSSLVDTIHFYVSEIGGTQDIEWVANVKRADGKIGYKKLSPTWDNDIQEYYVSLSLSQWFTAKNGDIFISLNGYQGGLTLEYDSTSQVYTSVSGTPIVQATGCIKLNISYAVQMNNDYGELPSISVQEALGLTTSKLDKNSGKYLKVIDDIANINSGSYTPFLSNGDIVYCKTNKAYYSLSFSDNLYTATLLDLTLFSNIKILGKILTSQNNTYGFKFENTSLFTSDKTLATQEYIDNYLNLKADKIGALPKYGTISSSTDMVDFIQTNNLNKKPFIFANPLGVNFLGLMSYSQTSSGLLISTFNFYCKSLSAEDIYSGTISEMDAFLQVPLSTMFSSTYHKETEITNNKTTSLSGSSTNTQYPSAKCVYDNLQLKADKSDTYTIAQVDNLVSTVKANSYQKVDTTDYPTLQDFLDNYDNPEEGDIYLYPINTSDLTQGYYQYIWEEDSSEWINLGTTQIDLSNYVTLNTSQTITGVKTLLTGTNEARLNLVSSNCYITGQYGIALGFVIQDIPQMTIALDGVRSQTIVPINDMGSSLGTSSKRWSNLYVSGNISDGTNSIAIANIQEKMTALTTSEWDTMIGD